MPRAGVGQSPAYSPLVLRPAAGDLHLKIRHRGTRSSSAETVVEGVYDSGDAVPTRDVARRHRMWSRGAGWSSRPGGLDTSEEWDGLAESENACYRFGYICPSGEQTAISVTAAWGAPKKLISFNGDLWVIFDSRIAYFADGTGSLTDYYNNSGDHFTDAEVWNGSLRVAIQCEHTTPNYHSLVTITPSGAGYAAASNPVDGSDPLYSGMHQFRLLQTAFWSYGGVKAMRLVGQDSDYTFRWMTVPEGDPYDPNNWGTQVQIGDATHQIRRLVSSHDTVWAVKKDGVYAISDENASAGGENLTPYWAEQLAISDPQINVHYYGQWLVASNAMGIDLIDVNSWQVKDRPRPVHISHGRPNNTTLVGRYTSFCTDSGWLVAGLYGGGGVSHGKVLYGTPRQRESPAAGVTEMDWFAECGPFTTGHEIVCMVVNTTVNGRPFLWLGMQDQSGNPYLVKVELFLGTSPLADTSHRYNTAASVTFTDEHWAARAATKGAIRGELSVRNCGSGRKVDLYAVAGSTSSFPGTATASVTTNVETSTFNLVNSGAHVNGSVIRSKAVLTSTATAPVVIDEWGMKASLGFPLRKRGTWLVELNDATEGDLPNFEQPQTVEAALVALCESVEVFDALDDEGNTINVYLENVLPWRKEDSTDTDLGVHQKQRLLEVAWVSVD